MLAMLKELRESLLPIDLLQLLQVAVGELPVGREAGDVEVDVSPARVGRPLLDEVLNHLDHLADVRGRPGGDVRPADAKGVHVLVVFPDELLGQLPDGDLEPPRAGDDLVVHVCEVAHEGDLVAPASEVAADDVEDDGRPRVAEVAEVVDRHPADVHLHPAGLEGFERLLASGEGVVELDGHLPS